MKSQGEHSAMTLSTRLRENLHLIFYLILLALFAVSFWLLGTNVGDTFTRVTDSLSTILEVIIIVSLILILTKIVIVIGQKIFKTSFEKYIKSEMDTLAMWQLVSYLIWVVAFILLFLIFTSDPTGFGVSIGIVSAALVFILQKPLLNIAGWMVVIFKKPYAVGERIEIENKRGFVVEINLMYTQLREFGELEGAESAYTGRYFSFPNSFILEHDVVNYDKDMTYIWDEIKVSVTYESDHKRAKEIILKAVEETVGKHMRLTKKFIQSKFEFDALKRRIISLPTVRMRLSDSSVNFYAIYFVDLSVRGRVRSIITEKILDSFSKETMVSIAYPHLQLVPHLSSEEWQKERRGGRLFRKTAVGFYPADHGERMGHQTTLEMLREPPLEPAGKGREERQASCDTASEPKGVILLPISRLEKHQPLIIFLAGFARSLDCELRVLNIVKMKRRRQRQIDMDLITTVEKTFFQIKQDLDNVSMDIKVYYDPVQSILGAMSGENVRMVVIPWNSRTFPTANLYELLEKARSQPSRNCDIAVIKETASLKNIRKVLVPVGYGKNIVKFGSLLRHFALQNELELVLLGVAARREDRKATERRVDDFYNSVLNGGACEGTAEEERKLLVTRKVVIHKSTAEAIQEEAKGCQLVAIGGTGRRDLKSYLFGSIPDIVLRGSRVSVMVLQKGERE